MPSITPPHHTLPISSPSPQSVTSLHSLTLDDQSTLSQTRRRSTSRAPSSSSTFQTIRDFWIHISNDPTSSGSRSHRESAVRESMWTRDRSTSTQSPQFRFSDKFKLERKKTSRPPSNLRQSNSDMTNNEPLDGTKFEFSKSLSVSFERILTCSLIMRILNEIEKENMDVYVSNLFQVCELLHLEKIGIQSRNFLLIFFFFFFFFFFLLINFFFCHFFFFLSE
jgi:hypothetical protein